MYCFFMRYKYLAFGYARIDPCEYDLAGSRLAGPSTLLRRDLLTGRRFR